MASSGTKLWGGSGALGSVAGKIYAPGPKALSADAVSSTGNIALMTRFIAIDGATSTFSFDNNGFFGVKFVLNNQWG